MAATAERATVQHLTFRLAEDLYALDIGRVREVLDFGAVTRVPRTPDFLRGVINLRGSVVPVADLRLRFGMTMTARTVNTCVIITEVSVDGDAVLLGILADSVEEVVDLDPDSITPPPKIGTRLRTDFIRGMAGRDDRFLIILDIDRVFSGDDMTLVCPSETRPEAARS
jgi:purine-binding chemotaxis protein CheW